MKLLTRLRGSFPHLIILFATLCLTNACGSSERRLHRTFAEQKTGVLQLPSGDVVLHEELVTSPGAQDLEIVGSDTTLRAAPDFKGRALLVVDRAENVQIHHIAFDGNRDNIAAQPLEMAPPENAFRVWYPNNGILADQVQGLSIVNVWLKNVRGFPILVSRSSKIRMLKLTVEDSGGKDPRGRNNLSGGVLIEEGSKSFEVHESIFHRILGNGLWTHSLRTSGRLDTGVFAKNEFDTIGRDAIQVGHATKVRVEDNTGRNIGFPAEIVDIEHGGTPVAIDTAGNVDQTLYLRNTFEDINGKCIDLDGFHDGAVRENRCTNRKRPEIYPHGHFGIVMNNTDPDAESKNIEIAGNTLDGTKFGALFVMGSGHTITGNHFVHLNFSGCNESQGKVDCIYKKDEPKMLESGIYLGRGVARKEETKNNTIRENEITGHKMESRCVVRGPGVAPGANTVNSNDCQDQ
jgi:hypothetical protein